MVATVGDDADGVGADGTLPDGADGVDGIATARAPGELRLEAGSACARLVGVRLIGTSRGAVGRVSAQRSRSVASMAAFDGAASVRPAW